VARKRGERKKEVATREVNNKRVQVIRVRREGSCRQEAEKEVEVLRRRFSPSCPDRQERRVQGGGKAAMVSILLPGERHHVLLPYFKASPLP
jgi:hypothetical protein